MKTWTELGVDTKGQTSGKLKTRCPLRCSKHEADEDVSVDLDKGAYKCHNPGCTFRGWLDGRVPRISRDSRYDRSSFDLPDRQGFEARAKPLPPEILDYFATRGISPATLEKNHVSWGVGWWDKKAEAKVEVIFFPYEREGQLVNVKKRSLDKDFRMVNGAELILWGIDRREKTLVITEGEIDALSFNEVGVWNCVSVPNGATEGAVPSLNYLAACADELSEVDHFILALDDDKPGRALREELAVRLGKEHCSYVVYPEGCKDANDVLVKHGPAGVASLVLEARPFPVAGIVRPLDLLDELLAWKRDGMPSGFSTGWSNLDEFWKVLPGELTIVTGVPSHGKSEILDALVFNLWRLHGWRTVIFSPENNPNSSHAVKLLERMVGKPFDDGVAAGWRAGRYQVQAMTSSDIREASAELQDAVSFLSPDEDAFTLDQILDHARAEVYRRGIKIMIIDPWNEIEHQDNGGMSETLYISKCLSRIRSFSRHNQVHTFVVAHPTKLQPQYEKYKDGDQDKVRAVFPVPTPYHISGSAAWYNKADNCLSIWRDEYAEAHGESPHLNQIVVAKVKKKWVGRKGTAYLEWYPPTGTYSIPPDGSAQLKTPIPFRRRIDIDDDVEF